MTELCGLGKRISLPYLSTQPAPHTLVEPLGLCSTTEVRGAGELCGAGTFRLVLLASAVPSWGLWP